MGRKPFNPSLVHAPKQKEAAGTPRHLTVTQLTRLVQTAIKTELPATVHVVGEISNLKRHSSGHLYFTLKDRGSELSCVMWRSDTPRLKFDPTDGLEVIATGGVDVFERSGRYQLYVRRLEPRGVGNLELAFRQLHEKLEGEGLFDERHKRPIPLLPMRVCVITSPTGAAIVDILRTMERRCPIVSLFIYPVRVQGEGAGKEIAAAIARVNQRAAALGGIDTLIVGRGGGSLEDLWVFNEERVARAIYRSAIPVVSGVGHEVDVTIADLVADVRAATPTAAAEIAVPVLDDLLAELEVRGQMLTRGAMSKLQLWSARMKGLLRGAVWSDPVAAIHRREQLLDELANRQYRGLMRRVRCAGDRVKSLEPAVDRLRPERWLLRSTVALRDSAHRLRSSVASRLGRAERSLMVAESRRAALPPTTPLLAGSQHLDHLANRLQAAMRRSLDKLNGGIDSKEELLGALGYRSVLKRGFSITRIKKGKRVVRSVKELRDGDRIVTELSDGSVESNVVNLEQLELFE